MDTHLQMEVPVLTADNGTALARTDELLSVGTPNAAQLTEINRRMPLVGELSADDIFVWAIQAGNNLTHAYHMWLDESSLKLMADGANQGRGYPYLRNHDSGSDPHGRVFAGLLRDDGSRPAAPLPDGAVPLARDVMRPGGNLVRLFEAIYMPRGLVINGISNDDLIRNLETGVQASNSLGLGLYSPLEPGSGVYCDIDGADMFRSDYELCPHWPGNQYEVMLGKGDDAKKSVVTATGRVVNAHQDEVSGVFLGAVPDTFTERALGLFRAGHMSLKEARRIEHEFRLTRGRIVGDAQTIVDMGRQRRPVVDIGAAGARGNSEGGEEVDNLLERVKALFAGEPERLAALELHDPEKDPLAALSRVYGEELKREREARSTAEATLAAHIKAEGEWLGLGDNETVAAGRARKDQLAAVGTRMMGVLVAEYLKQRTRAGLPADDAVKAIAERYTPDQLEQETKALKAAADKQFGPGRVTEPDVASRADAEPPAKKRARRMVRV